MLRRVNLGLDSGNLSERMGRRSRNACGPPQGSQVLGCCAVSRGGGEQVDTWLPVSQGCVFKSDWNTVYTLCFKWNVNSLCIVPRGSGFDL